jgi:hypothetical protein
MNLHIPIEEEGVARSGYLAMDRDRDGRRRWRDEVKMD